MPAVGRTNGRGSCPHFFIFALFNEQPITELAFLLRSGELELQRFHPPDVVDAEHPLLHLPGHPRDRSIGWVDLGGKPHLVAPPELLLGVAKLGLPEHRVQIGQRNLGAILLDLAVVQPYRCPCSAHPSCHQQGFVT